MVHFLLSDAFILFDVTSPYIIGSSNGGAPLFPGMRP